MGLFAVSIPMVLYYIYGYAVPLTILAVFYGFRWKTGLWSNILSLGAVMFSVLVAVGWWEELAFLLAKKFPSWLFVADCVAIWTIFLVTLLVMDTLTRLMSTIKVKFSDIAENVGNGAVLFLLFLVMYGFFRFAEELGPVGEHHSTETVAESTIPINMFRLLSAGNLSGFTTAQQFDDRGDFRELHQKRRRALMYNVTSSDAKSIQFKDDKIKIETLKRND
jgi:signal transduction histidine kinase